MEREDLLGNVRANEAYFAGAARGLWRDMPIVGDVRGAGYFWALELVKDQATGDVQRRGVATGCCATSCRAGCSRPA